MAYERLLRNRRRAGAKWVWSRSPQESGRPRNQGEAVRLTAHQSAQLASRREPPVCPWTSSEGVASRHAGQAGLGSFV